VPGGPRATSCTARSAYLRKRSRANVTRTYVDFDWSNTAREGEHLCQTGFAAAPLPAPYYAGRMGVESVDFQHSTARDDSTRNLRLVVFPATTRSPEVTTRRAVRDAQRESQGIPGVPHLPRLGGIDRLGKPRSGRNLWRSSGGAIPGNSAHPLSKLMRPLHAHHQHQPVLVRWSPARAEW